VGVGVDPAVPYLAIAALVFGPAIPSSTNPAPCLFYACC